METLTKIWQWLNGKKTIIGGAFLFVAAFLTEVIVGKWHYEPLWMQPTIDTAMWLGMAVMAGGFTHKAMKK